MSVLYIVVLRKGQLTGKRAHLIVFFLGRETMYWISLCPVV